MIKVIRNLLALIFLLSASFSHAGIIPIDLNDFYADPTVIVSLDGSSATLNEDENRIVVLLSNDPLFGDPGIVVPSGLMWLRFSYDFVEGVANTDNFYAKVFDGGTGDIIHDFLIESSGLGPVAWNLQGLSPTITVLGLEFQLNSYDTVFDSTVNISDVQLEYSVPEPGTLILLFSGLLGIMGFRRNAH